MNYTIVGDSDNPIVRIELQEDEQVKIENGSMVYLQNVEIVGKTNSKSKGLGGLVRAAARSLASGESVFITIARGLKNQSQIGIAPAIPGKVSCLKVDAMHQYRLNTGAFLASDDQVDYLIKKQDLGKAVFGGTGGLFVMEAEGVGDILINAFGDLIELEVSDDMPLTIDNEHVVAWDSNLDYAIRVASGTFGFTTGEGLVNEFHGNGKVWIQTRNIHNLADRIRPYIPTKS